MTKSSTNKISLYGKPLEYIYKPLEYMYSYRYLGKSIAFKNNKDEEEVERRINIIMSWKKFWSWKEILKGSFPLHLKKTMMDTCILPTLLYGCQTWTYSTKIKTKLGTCQFAMERSILKRKIHKIRSEHIKTKTELIDAPKYALTRKWRWAGHLVRYTDRRWTLETTTWEGPIGIRRKARPRSRWIEEIIATTGK